MDEVRTLSRRKPTGRTAGMRSAAAALLLAAACSADPARFPAEPLDPRGAGACALLDGAALAELELPARGEAGTDGGGDSCVWTGDDRRLWVVLYTGPEAYGDFLAEAERFGFRLEEFAGLPSYERASTGPPAFAVALASDARMTVAAEADPSAGAGRAAALRDEAAERIIAGLRGGPES
ncbi:hypothetical protein [Allonocardiopsis opalescens]|uniref:DUF3558 domain-containing protein n=1 Tax=Allonocardiopsis opalescens TaxID=1144618 RepID=A0A2T0Q4J0_9ACTN|nr:hypothetical protein [Allonocardiopsis opalescens]PRX98712.1 hypothetical protein CLV72_104291 [Allonocardiopsis opalescens]